MSLTKHTNVSVYLHERWIMRCTLRVALSYRCKHPQARIMYGSDARQVVPAGISYLG